MEPVACEQPMALPPINGIIVAQRGEGVDEKVAVEVVGMKGVMWEVDIDLDVEEWGKACKLAVAASSNLVKGSFVSDNFVSCFGDSDICDVSENCDDSPISDDCKLSVTSDGSYISDLLELSCVSL